MLRHARILIGLTVLITLHELAVRHVMAEKSSKEPQHHPLTISTPPPLRDGKCRVVSFANGGKCGSTTLATLLKHRFPDYAAHDPESLFEESPKEVCGQRYTCTRRPFYLDACPRVMTNSRIQALREYDPTMVVVVFVRPQHEALLSLYNDRGSSGYHRESSDVWVLKNKDNPLFNYTDVYERVARVFHNTLLVETHELQRPEYVLRRITDARGMPPIRSRPIVTNPSLPNAGRHTKAYLSNETVDRVQKHWAATNAKLCVRAPSLRLCET